MEIQPIVVGTAGHIDHGKSTLVQALTGIDPDRLKEEKERGMTIDLGFARFQLPDGRRVGIVDVPGHERFVKNMVAGATGIDLVVLVVAADDGVMPQTREHLAIMNILGIRRGLVALTKIDMVEEELVELAAEDVRGLLAGTFLAEAPLIPVSAITGEGLEAFKSALSALASEAEPRSAGGLFRMPIQRVFSAKGFGTVVTGIPVSGDLQVGAVAELLPAGQRVKVRGIQAYQETSRSARAGHSSAINLSDVSLEDVRRGHVLATPGFFRPMRMVAARFEALAGLGRPVPDRLSVRLHTGTSETLGELVLLDCDVLEPGAQALVQLRLEEPVVCAPGDRFVLRRASPAETLGGGAILEESRHRLKRFKKFVLEHLERTSGSLGSPGELLEAVLARIEGTTSTPEQLAVEIKRPREEVRPLLAELEEAGSAVALGNHGWVHARRLAEARQRLQAALEEWFREHAHREVVDVRDLRRLTGYEAAFLDALLEVEEAGGRIERSPGGLVRPAGRAAQADPRTEEAAARVLAVLEASPFQPPLEPELASRSGLDGGAVRAALELLVDRRKVLRVGPELFLAGTAYARARAEVVANCERNGSLDIPSLRDALGTSRKYLIPLLEQLDAQGVTIRQGANRVLRRR
jgi:selenocysteine-specific elongation factor